MVEVRGLKFHCCRTISLKGPVWLSAQRRVNCCVRSTFGSEKRSHIRRVSLGSSNKSRIVCSPGWLARQPRLSPCLNADSIGYFGSSEETSTRAISSRFSHPSDISGGFGSVSLIICFRILGVSHENLIQPSVFRKIRQLGVRKTPRTPERL